MKCESFRNKLIENPGNCIEAETMMKIQDWIQITIMEVNPHIVYLILPKLPTQESEIELSEAEQEIVAGGVTYTQ